MIFYTFWVVRAICCRMAFSMKKVRFCGQTINPLPQTTPPPRPCHTIKNCEWEKMDCSLPSHSVVLLLDGIIGPRWQAGRQEASSSSIWPSGRWSGPQVPGLGSLQMCLMLLFRSCFLPLQGIFTGSHFGPEELTGSCLGRGSYVFPSGVIFYTKMCRSKGIYEYSIRAISLKTWDAKLREERGDVETNHTVSLFLHLFLLQLFLSYWNQISINTKGSTEGDKMRKGKCLSPGRRKSSLGSSDWAMTWARAWELEHVLHLSFLQ